MVKRTTDILFLVIGVLFLAWDVLGRVRVVVVAAERVHLEFARALCPIVKLLHFSQIKKPQFS